MPKRLARLAALAGAILLIALPAAASAAPSPWWQVLDGSRPSNMWEPGSASEVQKVEVSPIGGFTPGSAFAGKVEIDGKVVGCLGAGEAFGFIFANTVCENETSHPADETAAELEATLEAAYGGNVEVSGGPVGVDVPFEVTTPGRWVHPLKVTVLKAFGFFVLGFARTSVVSQDSGSLIATITNLGDAPVDATETPVRIVDELPEGVVAYGYKIVPGIQGEAGDAECAIEAPDEVACEFEGTLPPYEAIEVEVHTVLTGSPPDAAAPGAAPGQITVSGGNAKSASSPQRIEVSPEPTSFGIERFSTQAEEEGGALTRHAGAHPFQVTNTIQFDAGRVIPSRGNTTDERETEQPAQPRNVDFPLPAGLVGNASAVPQCEMADFFVTPGEFKNECSDDTAIGVASVTIVEGSVLGVIREAVPVFNLTPAPGEPARFGFVPLGDAVVIDTAVDPEDGYRIAASVHNVTQLPQFLSSTVSLWGTPGDTSHDSSRGWSCVPGTNPAGSCQRPPGLSESSFLRMPVSCNAPLDYDATAEQWNVAAGTFDSASFTGEPLLGCNKVPFDPKVSGAPTSKLASSPSGFDFTLNMPNSGLNSAGAIAEGQPKKVTVTLPEGMTVNPSSGEGLVGCTPAEYARETASSESGAGCPDASRIGDVSVSTPLLKEEAKGALYIAAPHNNSFDSLLALYMVARIPERGILIKQAGVVRPDPQTGQLTTVFDNLPQLPFTTFHLHFREGGRAPLVTPPACGTYTATARFVPWSAQDPNNPAPNEIVERPVGFNVERGFDGGACPPKSTRPFHPGLLAGTVTNAAGRFSPFNVRLTRNDGEQEFTHFSIKLPPGITGKLAGVPYCSDAAIAQAKARTGIHGGQEELDHPSCPAASQVGRTLVGAGVGSILTYVPGKLYLAGPYHGAPLSMVAITSGVVGPFDIGTVVVRQAFRIDPETAEVFVDATGSDAIPHIIQGIPVHARDIRAYVDRPEFTINPTSCAKTSTASTVLGSGLDFASEADDNPITVTSPFQAADCAALDFSPKLSLQLKGGTRRGAHPAFKATLKMHGFGDAAIKRAQVTLPRSEFIENAHFKTICTRVQFKAGAGNGAECPPNSVYGHAKAITPILDGALEGPVFLRSSEHQLPDLVAALHSPNGIDFALVGRVDSVKGGGLRNTFEAAPDAPVTSFVLTMQGGKKGLFVNSTNLCVGKHEADVSFDAHNGKIRDFRSPLKAQCGKGGKAKKHRGAK